MMEYTLYAQFDKSGDFIGFDFQVPKKSPLPENAVAITEAQHIEYLDLLNTQIKKLTLKNNKIAVVEKYTAEEMKKREDELKSILLKEKAQNYLNQNKKYLDWIFYESATIEEKELVRIFINQCYEVINGKSSLLPDYEAFISKMNKSGK